MLMLSDFCRARGGEVIVMYVVVLVLVSIVLVQGIVLYWQVAKNVHDQLRCQVIRKCKQRL